MRKIWAVTKLRNLDFKNAGMFYQELLERALFYELPGNASSAARTRAVLLDLLREKHGVPIALLNVRDYGQVEQRLGVRLDDNERTEVRRFSYAANYDGCDSLIADLARSSSRSNSPHRMEMRHAIAATITPNEALGMLVTIDEHARYRKKEFHQEMRSRGLMKGGLLARNFESEDFKLAHRRAWAVHKLYGCYTLQEAAKYYQELKRRAWDREVEPIDYAPASTSTTTRSERQQTARSFSSHVHQQSQGSPEQLIEGVGVPVQPLQPLRAIKVIHVKPRGAALSRRNDHTLSL
jgi:hypothetical protein